MLVKVLNYEYNFFNDMLTTPFRQQFSEQVSHSIAFDVVIGVSYISLSQINFKLVQINYPGLFVEVSRRLSFPCKKYLPRFRPTPRAPFERLRKLLGNRDHFLSSSVRLQLRVTSLLGTKGRKFETGCDPGVDSTRQAR